MWAAELVVHLEGQKVGEKADRENARQARRGTGWHLRVDPYRQPLVLGGLAFLAQAVGQEHRGHVDLHEARVCLLGADHLELVVRLLRVPGGVIPFLPRRIETGEEDAL